MLPINPTPAQLEKELAVVANSIATLSDLVARYKADAALKETAYKRRYAEALVKYSGAKNATIAKSMAEIDPDVRAAQDELDQANAVYIVAMGEYSGYDSQFIALRKIVHIREMEMRAT